jgi:hypothetical protein
VRTLISVTALINVTALISVHAQINKGIGPMMAGPQG